MISLSRRAFIPAATAALVGASIGPATSQVNDPRPPTVDTSNPREIAAGVWVIGDHRTWLVPNIGIILGTDAALVVDTGLGPANGERVLDLARRLAGPRRLLLTVTHFHPEHGYGAQAFRPDATIIYNRTQRDELREKGEGYVGLFRQTQSKAAADALDGTKIVMPHVVYDGPSAQIDLGGRMVELRNLGHRPLARRPGRLLAPGAHPVRRRPHRGAHVPDLSVVPAWRRGRGQRAVGRGLEGVRVL
jgi:hypothetical protein